MLVHGPLQLVALQQAPLASNIPQALPSS